MNKRSAISFWKTIGLSGEPVFVGGGLWSYVVRITPVIAKRILDDLNIRNRDMKHVAVRKYTEEMEADRWKLTGEPILFSDKRLLNGQNRLQAVIKSGKSIMIVVIIGIEDGAAVSLDENAVRNARDAARMQGKDWDKRWLAVVKNIHRGGGKLNRPVSNSMALTLYEHYTSLVNWLIANVPSGRVTNSAVTLAAIGRAYQFYRTNNQKVHIIKNFADVLAAGQIDGRGENYEIVVKLRDRCMSSRYWGSKDIHYCLVGYVLSKVLAGQKLVRLPRDRRLKRLRGIEFFPSEEDDVEELDVL